ncbi:CLK4-associating serine/arginine rich protein-like isoform X2 [Actinia tenebrosa]|uniref:CLK4-associating serine/arginine rich protein-like isoform X2 n=1 Tax=Actinia tenebrosa TaxID=6105 RepID=A0A6P8ICJ8_ACTTE|nr:CLK4-associating serine/arginine rich protein-like isoform X2 [Actinia tenebrosa]
MAFAYHMEALRKQRIMDRKHAALARIAILQAEAERKQKEDEVRTRRIKHEQEEAKSKERERYLNSMGRTSKSKQGVINANYTSMLEDQKIRIAQKDLKHQEKVLRDHCLVMGHANEYFLA